MSKLMELLTGNIGGVDIGVIIAALGYVFKVGVEIKDWWSQRKEERIDRIILDAINWVYVNKVQKEKKENGSLTTIQSSEAHNAAVQKAAELGVAIDPEALSGRVQSVFSRIKTSLGNSDK